MFAAEVNAAADRRAVVSLAIVCHAIARIVIVLAQARARQSKTPAPKASRRAAHLVAAKMGSL